MTKEEKSAYNKAYREANAERIKAKTKAWREANKDKVKESKQAWSEANKDKVKECKKAYYERNVDKVKKRCKAYYEANTERIKAQTKAWINANADKVKESRKAYREANADKLKESNKAWSAANQDIRYTGESKKRALKFNRLHPDHDVEIERSLYILAKNCEAIFNEPFDIDHILPYSCGGWHHNLNLQVIPARINRQKNNNPDYECSWPNYKTWRDLPDFLLKDKNF